MEAKGRVERAKVLIVYIWSAKLSEKDIEGLVELSEQSKTKN